MTERLPPTIPEYFSGKNVFVTGATGFIGKVLVEKLLRSCPDIGNIYVLIRQKKGKAPEERIKDMTDLPLFDVLKKEHPDNLQKIVPILGDVVELDLDISPEARKMLTKEVNIIYHIAASVRFDDSLRDAVIMNTRGTREVVKLAREMQHLEVFFHFSTTFCHTDKTVVDEKIYPALADWRTTIELVENADPHVLQVLTSKYTHPLPNTYTFSKSLGEHVVNDMCNDVIPAIILRPSIVISSMLEPFSGWIDNFNGPVGILVASGKGIMRTIHADPNIIADYMPCDILVKGAILGTWKKAMEKEDERYKLSIYNGSSNEIRQVTLGEMVHMGKKLCWETPLNDILWYPNGSITKCLYYNYFRLIFYQLLPALFVDGLLKLLKKKPILIKVHRRIYIANTALMYFLTNEWMFINKNAIILEESLLESDRAAFSYEKDHELTEPFKFFTMGLMGARRYLLNEPDSTFEKAKVHSRRMWLIGQVFNATWYIAGFLLLLRLFSNIDIVATMNSIHTYFNT